MAEICVLQIGLGGFGRNHLRAWVETGLGRQLYVADSNTGRFKEAKLVGLADQRLTTDYFDFLGRVEVVDIVTPSTSHFDLPPRTHR